MPLSISTGAAIRKAAAQALQRTRPRSKLRSLPKAKMFYSSTSPSSDQKKKEEEGSGDIWSWDPSLTTPNIPFPRTPHSQAGAVQGQAQGSGKDGQHWGEVNEKGESVGSGAEEVWDHETGTGTGVSTEVQNHTGWHVPRNMLPTEEQVWDLDGEVVERAIEGGQAGGGADASGVDGVGSGVEDAAGVGEGIGEGIGISIGELFF